MIKIYKVGGAVRDSIMGIPAKDIDFAVEAESYVEMYNYIRSNGTIFLENPEFFTVRAKLNDGQPADFVLCRKEYGYSDGRHPDRVEVGTIYDDLARRDFTVNAIAQTLDGELIDPYEGRKHIEEGVLVAVGKPEDRFREDSLRMLRAFRFVITRGFLLDNSIVKCLSDYNLVELLSLISFDRIREELNRCFRADALRTLILLETYPLIRNVVFTAHKELWLEVTNRK